VSFAAITLCDACQRVFIVVSVYFFVTQSGYFWIYLRTLWKNFFRGLAWLLAGFMVNLDPALEAYSRSQEVLEVVNIM
jgi:hypothetical protein